MKSARVVSIVAAVLLAQAAQAEPRTVAIAAETSNQAANPRIFLGSRDPETARGDIIATRAGDTAGTAPGWSAASMLDTHPISARTLLTSDASHGAFALDWNLLTLAHRTLLASHGLDEAALAYLRGDRRGEGTATGFLPRASRLGELVNGNFWLVRTPANSTQPDAGRTTLYIGTGDGMLHGFDTATGTETMAYVPRGLLPRLASRIRGNDPQPHAVDGPLFGAFAPVGPESARRHLLVGALGAGGKGYFVLDVTDLASATAAGGSGLVLVDTTASTDPDLGHIYTPPVVDADQAYRTRQIVRMNNRRWATVMGNGYYSAQGRPVLLIQYLDGARELVKLSPCVDGQPCADAGDNGLSAPQLIDVDGDGMVDVAYAGDLRGQLWKFDLSANPAAGGSWRIGFSGQPFFTARALDGQRQPITTAPHWMPHPQGGLMLAFGTGRNLRADDAADVGIQSIYGVRDDSVILRSASGVKISDSTPIPSDTIQSRAAVLVQHRYGAGRSDGGITYFDASREAVVTTGPQAHRGWWIDLPHPGQRVLQNPRSFEGQKLLIHSVRPMPDATTPASVARVWSAGESYLSVFNMLTGHPPAQPAFAPQDATLATAAIGMASVPAGPVVQSRVGPGGQELRFPDGQKVQLRTSRTLGARAGWRER
jgi:type IV pilus assembly protein PilY1